MTTNPANKNDNTLVLLFLAACVCASLFCCISSLSTSAFLLSGEKNDKDDDDDGSSPSPTSYKYEFIMNKKNEHLGIHIGWIKLDGVLVTKEQTTIHKPPNRNNLPDNMFNIGSVSEKGKFYAAWNEDGHEVGDKIFTIISSKKVNKIEISYWRPTYGPGWIIKENGVKKITETSNRGDSHTPNPVEYTYNI